MLVTLLLLPIVHTLLKKYVYLHVAAMIILFAVCLIMTSLSWKAGFPNQSFVPQFLRIWVFGLFFLFGGFVSVRIVDRHDSHEGSRIDADSICLSCTSSCISSV